MDSGAALRAALARRVTLAMAAAEAAAGPAKDVAISATGVFTVRVTPVALAAVVAALDLEVLQGRPVVVPSLCSS